MKEGFRLSETESPERLMYNILIMGVPEKRIGDKAVSKGIKDKKLHWWAISIHRYRKCYVYLEGSVF